MSIHLIKDISTNSFTAKAFLVLTVQLIVVSVGVYFIRTQKQFDYDDIEQVLFVVDLIKQIEIEIPVEKIDKILFSEIGIRGKGSFIIVYRDFHDQPIKVRLFPILFDDSIDTIIRDSKIKNPNLITSSWNFGWLSFLLKK